MTEIKVPGIVYSLLLAIGAWAVDYFTGSSYSWSPILLATIPVLLKMFTVGGSDDEIEPAAQSRGFGATPARSKLSKLLLG